MPLQQCQTEFQYDAITNLLTSSTQQCTPLQVQFADPLILDVAGWTVLWLELLLFGLTAFAWYRSMTWKKSNDH